jgi:hypothetical protein
MKTIGVPAARQADFLPIERFPSSRALSGLLPGGFFLRKNPLGVSGFGG